jgi:hypothetical protein
VRLSTRSEGLIRGLLYPVQFDQNPQDGLERTLTTVVEPGRLDASPEQFLAAIKEALASGDRLSEIIPETHTENTIREYLTALAECIEAKFDQLG